MQNLNFVCLNLIVGLNEEKLIQGELQETPQSAEPSPSNQEPHLSLSTINDSGSQV